MFKLTLVTVTFRNRTNVKMVSAEIGRDGKARVSMDILERMAREMGAKDGDTFSWG